jgi:hypothetical protein
LVPMHVEERPADSRLGTAVVVATVDRSIVRMDRPIRLIDWLRSRSWLYFVVPAPVRVSRSEQLHAHH